MKKKTLSQNKNKTRNPFYGSKVEEKTVKITEWFPIVNSINIKKSRRQNITSIDEDLDAAESLQISRPNR
jgi:hypothetical protein